ncbi:hypothetical protein V8B55DRAFT_1570236 [Mucor lusitanicus]
MSSLPINQIQDAPASSNMMEQSSVASSSSSIQTPPTEKMTKAAAMVMFKNMDHSTVRFKECYDYLSEAFERWAAILNEDASGKAKLDDETADAIAKADHNSVRPIDNKKALTEKRKREVIVIDDGEKSMLLLRH